MWKTGVTPDDILSRGRFYVLNIEPLNLGMHPRRSPLLLFESTLFGFLHQVTKSTSK